MFLEVMPRHFGGKITILLQSSISISPLSLLVFNNPLWYGMKVFLQNASSEVNQM